MIVTLPALVVSEHIGDDTESGEAIAGFFGVGIDLAVGRFLAVVGFCVLVYKGGASLVGVQVSGSLAVDFVDLVDSGALFDADPRVESNVQALVLLDSVVELEYFIVYTRLELADAQLAMPLLPIINLTLFGPSSDECSKQTQQCRGHGDCPHGEAKVGFVDWVPGTGELLMHSPSSLIRGSI